ncbi:hypothetical protein LguiA_026704 [Lonicera macranthoides]
MHGLERRADTFSKLAGDWSGQGNREGLVPSNRLFVRAYVTNRRDYITSIIIFDRPNFGSRWFLFFVTQRKSHSLCISFPHADVDAVLAFIDDDILQFWQFQCTTGSYALATAVAIFVAVWLDRHFYALLQFSAALVPCILHNFCC